MSNKLLTPPTPTGNVQLDNWLRLVYDQLNSLGQPVKAESRTNLPTASDYGNTDRTFLIYVHDAVGGAALAYSDGTSWISTKTGAAV